MQNVFSRGAATAVASAVVSVGFLLVPVFASAATLNVGPSATYHTIQAAINAASTGDVITVAAGTYDAFSVVGKTNLSIIGAGAASTIIKPTALINTGVAHKYTADMQSSVFVNTSTNVVIQGLTVEDNGNAPGAGGPDALVFWNASSGSINNDAITGTYAINGVQTGQGIAVDAGSGQTTVLTVSATNISGFQKNGIDVVDGNSLTSNPGTITLTVTGGSITGAGSTNTIAQNGILLWSRGGGSVTGTVNGTALSSLEYAPTPEATGVLAYGTASVSKISNVSFKNIDLFIKSASSGTTIDAATGNTFDGISPATATGAQLATIENKLYGITEDTTVDPVNILPNTLIVTTSNLGVQSALNVAISGSTVFVTPGVYSGSLTITKNNIKLIGASEAGVTVNENAADAFGYGFTVDHATGASISNLSFIVPAASPIGFAFHAYHADGLTLSNLSFTGPGKTSTKIGGVDINTTNNVTETNVSSSNFYKNGFSFTSQYVVADAAADGIALSGITANNNGWSGVAFYTVGNDRSTNSPASIGGSHSFAAVSLLGTNTISGNTRGIQVEGTSDAAEGAGTTPVNTVTTNGTTLDLTHIAFSNNATDVLNYQTAPVNAIGATFGGLTGDGMTGAQQIVEDGKIVDQLDLASLGLVHYYNPPVGTLDITKYACPAGTTVVRSANGVGLTVPAGCVAQIGATFGYVHGTQTDANAPDPELGAALTAAGATDATGNLTVPNLLSAGRYLVEETDGNNQRLPDSSVLGLYCTGDGDQSNNNDNQELTFVPANGVDHCVSYDQMTLTAPTNLLPADGTYTNDTAFSDTWTPVPGAAKYEYQTANTLNGVDLGTIIYSDNSTSGNYVITPTLITRHNGGTPEGVYYWHVRAVDALGNVGPWSVINKVTVDTTAPTVPTLLTPSNSSTIPTNDFMFTWTASSDANPVTYEFQSSLNSASTDGVLTTGIWDSITSAGMTLTDPSIHSTGANDGTWNWQVRAIDAAGNKSAWSPIWTVTLNTNAPVTPSVTTNDATVLTTSGATVNGTNGPVAADNTSFWWGTTPIGALTPQADASGEFPAGWNHDSGLGNAAVNAPFAESLTGLTSGTTYNFVAWSHVGGVWYPGTQKTFTTATVPVDPAPAAAVTTNAATNVSSVDAQLNGTVGPTDADFTSFWVSTAPIVTSSANIPAGVYSTPVIPTVTAGKTFSDPLSIVSTQGIVTGGVSDNLAIQPSTTYYYVAWAYVGGNWIPGVEQTFTTTATPPAPLAAASQTLSTNDGAVLPITLGATGGAGTYTYILDTSALQHGAITGTGANLTYTPVPFYVGDDSFAFKVNDGTNDSNTATVTIHNKDTVAPVITLTGSNPASIVVGNTYVDPGVSVTDKNATLGYSWSVDDGATSTDATEISVNTLVAGTHTIFISATDGSGNTATVSRVVNVVAAPVVTPTVQLFGGNGPILGSFTGVAGDTTGQSGSSGSGSISGNTAPLPGGTGGSVLGAETFNFKTNLRIGSRIAPDVTELQKVLITAGYLRISAPTGFFGSSTLAAVKLYQGAHKITVTGFVGPLTRAALNLGTTPAATN